MYDPYFDVRSRSRIGRGRKSKVSAAALGGDSSILPRGARSLHK